MTVSPMNTHQTNVTAPYDDCKINRKITESTSKPLKTGLALFVDTVLYLHCILCLTSKVSSGIQNIMFNSNKTK